jgi:superfamily II DNA or RNA helicase
MCGTELADGWHADHVHPYSKQGPTDVTNGAAVCPDCNLRKGARMTTNVHTLRDWQAKFLHRFADQQGDFTLVACPAAGKTSAAFAAARHQIDSGQCDRLIVVVPSDSLRSSVVDAGGEWGFKLKRNDHRNQLLIPRGYDGIVTTYASIAAQPNMYADWVRRHRVFAVMDEVHHAGDRNEWGAALTTALNGASRRLLMSGTPWRKSGDAIPFASYDVDGRLRFDYQFTFRDAWQEDETSRAVRYVEFTWMDANVHFVTSRGVEVNQLLSECDDDLLGQALTNVYMPNGEWVAATIREANRHLDSVRLTERPDAAGLILAPSVEYAHRYADLVAIETGRRPVVVVSDDDSVDSGAAIARFRDGCDPWIIAVRQISEGVDIPRLIVEVFASDIKTPLFFHQAVGRILRRRRDGDGWVPEPRYARVYLPPASPFQVHAGEMEDMLSSALKEKEGTDGPSPRDDGGDVQSSLRLDFGNDAAYVAGMSFATGGSIDPDELAAAQEMLGSARFMASELLKKGVKFPTRPTLHTRPATEFVTERYDPRELDRLKEQVETYARRWAIREGMDFKDANGQLYKLFGKRGSYDVETCRRVIAWLGERL